MIRRAFIPWFAFISVFAALTGCQPQEPFHFFDDGDLSHYVDVATDIDYPDVESESLDEVTQSAPPLTLENVDVAEMWELTLEEAVHSALANSKVMRSLGGRYNATGRRCAGGGHQQQRADHLRSGDRRDDPVHRR